MDFWIATTTGAGEPPRHSETAAWANAKQVLGFNVAPTRRRKEPKTLPFDNDWAHPILMPKAHQRKVQPGNPHQLTIREHCFPKASICRFMDERGRVAVERLDKNDRILVPPDNELFCAHRAWDHHTESRFMRSIEDRFQEVVNKVIEEQAFNASQFEMDTVSAMYLLWNLREAYRDHPLPDSQLVGVLATDQPVTEDDCEYLERHGIMTIRSDLSISGSQMTGMRLKLRYDECTEMLKGGKWDLRISDGHGFVVPDRSFKRPILPLTPRLCLFHESLQYEQRLDVDELNQLARTGASRFVFSRP
jgi:hypothetical protein